MQSALGHAASAGRAPAGSRSRVLYVLAEQPAETRRAAIFITDICQASYSIEKEIWTAGFIRRSYMGVFTK